MSGVLGYIPVGAMEIEAVSYDHSTVKGEDVRDLLNGGFFETMPSGLFEGVIVLADEDGSMKQLPLNAYASAVLGYAIFGPVVFVRRADIRGESSFEWYPFANLTYLQHLLRVAL